MSVRQWIRRPLQARWLIRAVDRFALTGRPRPGAARHLVLAPPGRGNIGDQALIEAFVEALDAPVTLLVRSRLDVEVPEHLASRTRVLPLPALVYGSALGHARDARILSEELKDAASFSVLGADIMDGAYVVRASVNRADLAARLAHRGWPSRVIGFSWNARPHPAARAAMQDASAAGVQLMLRDPQSAGRARADGMDAVDSADIVFTALTRDDTTVARVIPDLGDAPLALVNASGLVGDRLGAYAHAIGMLRAAGMRVVIVPHVSRPGADDMPVCRALADSAPEDAGVTLVPRLLSPAEIRGLAARASLTVTGRMHLAVMSLMAGVPAVTVATQGKVEGLMELFGVPELAVSPEGDFDAQLRDAIRAALTDRDALVASIRAKLPQVIALARKNLAGMPTQWNGAPTPELSTKGLRA